MAAPLNINNFISNFYAEIDVASGPILESDLTGLPEVFKNSVIAEVRALAEPSTCSSELHPFEDRTKVKLAFEKALKKTVSDVMPEERRRQLFAKIAEMSPYPSEGEKWGETHVFDDMYRLARALDAIEFFHPPTAVSIGSESVSSREHTAVAAFLSEDILERPGERTFMDSLGSTEMLSKACSLSTGIKTPPPLRRIPPQIYDFAEFAAIEKIWNTPPPKVLCDDIKTEIKVFFTANASTLCTSHQIVFENICHDDFGSNLVNLFWAGETICQNPRMAPWVDLYQEYRRETRVAVHEGSLEPWKGFYKLFKIYSMLTKMHALQVPNFKEVQDFYHLNERIVSPTFHGLQLLCSYYEIKYGIDLFVETEDSFDSKMRSDAFPKDRPFGVIVPKFLRHFGHVMPRICCYNSSVLEAITLDSSAESCETSESYAFVPKPSKHLKIKHLFSTRQADAYSCRNDAIVILVNALLDLREKDTTDIFSYAKDATVLPGPWAKTIQTSRAFEKTDTSAPVRTKAGPIPLSLFIARYTRDGRRDYLLYKGYKFANLIVDMLENKEKYKDAWSLFESKLAST